MGGGDAEGISRSLKRSKKIAVRIIYAKEIPKRTYNLNKIFKHFKILIKNHRNKSTEITNTVVRSLLINIKSEKEKFGVYTVKPVNCGIDRRLLDLGYRFRQSNIVNRSISMISDIQVTC